MDQPGCFARSSCTGRFALQAALDLHREYLAWMSPLLTAQVVLEGVPPARLQQGDSGGGLLGAGEGFGTQGYPAGAGGGIGEYVADPLRKEVGGMYPAIA
jgi:hypothetical protein